MLSVPSCGATAQLILQTGCLQQCSCAAVVHLVRSNTIQGLLRPQSQFFEQFRRSFGSRAAMQAFHSSSGVSTRANSRTHVAASHQHTRRAAVPCRVAATSSNGNKRHSQQAASTGYLWHELYFWHCAGPWGNMKEFVQPMDHSPEHVETKRRLHNLLGVSGLMDQLHMLKPRPATIAELSRAHSVQYVETVEAMSEDYTKNIHRVGDESAFMPGGFQVAALAAGGAITATEAVLEGSVKNAYVLCRPPGHHAERGNGGGYCIFNNVAVAAHHALAHHDVSKIAIVDFDVHHGNGTQAIFEEDDRVLFISLHQAGNYPIASGGLEEVGKGRGTGYTLNVPLPPGSGGGAYRAAFDRVVGPALDTFQPELILVSAGYDASYMDPLGHMMLGSEDYRYFMQVMQAAADRHAAGRIVAVHEGGYSELYVPFCGLAVIEQMAHTLSKVKDPYWEDVSCYGYQSLQPHQDEIIKAAEQQLEKLRAAVKVPHKAGHSSAPKGGS